MATNGNGKEKRIQVYVESTTQYDKFSFIKGNRPIKPGHLARLISSINEINLLPWNPIQVNENLEVLDGQHRLEAARKLGLAIYYIVLPFGGLHEVQIYNTNKANWSVDDFLDSYVVRGNKQYIALKQFANRHDLTYPNALRILTGQLGVKSKSHDIVREFREGDFQITMQEYADKFVSWLRDIDEYLEPGVRHDRDFLRALDRAYKIITHEQFMEKLTDSGWHIRRNANTRGYLRNMEEILAYKSPHQKTRLF